MEGHLFANLRNKPDFSSELSASCFPFNELGLSLAARLDPHHRGHTWTHLDTRIGSGRKDHTRTCDPVGERDPRVAANATFTMFSRSGSPLHWISTPRPSTRPTPSRIGAVKSQNHDQDHTPGCPWPSMYDIFFHFFFFFGYLPVNTIWIFYAHHLEQHCMSKQRRRIFPTLASTLRPNEMLRLKLADFGMVPDMLRRSSFGVNADVYLLEIGWFIQDGIWKWSSPSVKPVAVQRRAGGGGSSSPNPRPLALFKESRLPPTSALNDDRWTRFPHSNLCLTRRSRVLRKKMTRPRLSGPTRPV